MNKIAVIETLGTPVGAVLAQLLGVGLVILRKGDERVNNKFLSILYHDYSHRDEPSAPQKRMSLLRDSISVGENIVLIDEMIDSAGQFLAAWKLITAEGANIVVGISENIMTSGREKLCTIGYRIEPDTEQCPTHYILTRCTAEQEEGENLKS